MEGASAFQMNPASWRDFVVLPFFMEQTGIQRICFFTIDFRITIYIKRRKRVFVPQTVAFMRLDQRCQFIKVLPESEAPLAAASLMFSVTGDEQLESMRNKRMPIIIDMLYNRMVQVPRIGLQQTNHAQIHPQNLVKFKYLL